MKLDSEEQREVLVKYLDSVPAIMQNEQGQIVPLTFGMMRNPVLPPDLEELYIAINGAEIEEPKK